MRYPSWKTVLLLACGSLPLRAEMEIQTRYLDMGTQRLEALHGFPGTPVTVAAGSDGAIFRSADGGASWELAGKPTLRALRAVHGMGATTAAAAGDGGVLVRTRDAGATWRALPSPTRADLRALHFADPSTGYAAGRGGAVLKTSDSGGTWQVLPTGVAADLDVIHFPDTRVGFAAGPGYVLLRTPDGGGTWDSLGIEFAGRPTQGKVVFTGIHFTDARNGFLAAEHVIQEGSGKHSTRWAYNLLLATRDGGSTWRSVAGVSPRAIQHLGGADWLVLSEGNLVRSVDGGET